MRALKVSNICTLRIQYCHYVDDNDIYDSGESLSVSIENLMNLQMISRKFYVSKP